MVFDGEYRGQGGHKTRSYILEHWHGLEGSIGTAWHFGQCMFAGGCMFEVWLAGLRSDVRHFLGQMKEVIMQIAADSILGRVR